MADNTGLVLLEKTQNGTVMFRNLDTYLPACIVTMDTMTRYVETKNSVKAKSVRLHKVVLLAAVAAR